MEVALIGKGPGRELAPLVGAGAVTWGVNDVVAHRQCDVCFWMDRHLMKDTQMDRLVTASVNKTGTPTYSVHAWDDIPSIQYPIDDVVKAFTVDHFADSFCYMLALAIYQGFNRIDLYGFNYSYGSNYMTEKPAAEFWIGVALGKGIIISIHGESDLLKTKDGRRYSYQTPQTMAREVSMSSWDRPEVKIPLTVEDRISLVGLLPKEGDYGTLRFAKDLRASLLFNDSEAKALNIRYVDNSEKKPLLIWDDNKIPDKEVYLTAAQVQMVAEWLLTQDRRGLLTQQHLGLYEKIVLGRAMGTATPPAVS